MICKVSPPPPPPTHTHTPVTGECNRVKKAVGGGTREQGGGGGGGSGHDNLRNSISRMDEELIGAIDQGTSSSRFLASI